MVLFGSRQKCGKRVIKFALQMHGWRLLINDSRDERPVGVGESSDSREDIRIAGGGLSGAEFGDSEGHRGQKLPAGLDGVGWNADVQEGSVRGQRTRMLVFVTMSGEKITAARRAVEGNFPFRAATHGADFLRFGGTKPSRFALFANWTRHERAPEELQGNRISRHDDFVVESASGNDEQQRAHEEKGKGVGPEMDPVGAAKNDATGDVDEISGGNEKAEGVAELGHGLAREDVTREKDAREDGQEGQLHGLRLGTGFAGNEDAERERNK
jgi:hypothetical protein